MNGRRVSKQWSLLCVAVVCAAGFAQGQRRTDLSKLVVVGDSLSAGVENLSLLDTQQVHGYAKVIARQANVRLKLPLVPYPGAPNVLQLTSLNPLTVVPVGGKLTVPRDKACKQATNVSVPGITLGQALTMTPAPVTEGGSPVQAWLNLVLGYPNPLASAECGTTGIPLTEVQQAVALQPTAIIEWLGNNDALVPALIGQLDALTPLSDFAKSYDTLLDTLKSTHAPIITATIPDVTKVPYFTPLSTFAAQVGIPVRTLASKLGIGPNDLLRPTAAPVAMAILKGTQPGPLKDCPAPPFSLPVATLPCVLTARDAAYVRTTVEAYNVIIFAESLFHGATVVDIHALVDELSENGYKADGKVLTTAFLGGVVSLDGIHPTNTGYAIIANRFIDVINRAWGTSISRADVDAIAARDPLVPPVKVPTNPH